MPRRRPLILVGVDGTETSLRAGAYSAGMALRQHGTVICLYVRAPGGITAAAPGAASAVAETQQDIAEEIQRGVAETSARLDIPIEYVERQGNPFKQIVALAESLRVDQVVVGASMQAGHRLVGSLAVHLVREAAWPVTVVP